MVIRDDDDEYDNLSPLHQVTMNGSIFSFFIFSPRLIFALIANDRFRSLLGNVKGLARVLCSDALICHFYLVTERIV